jgi:hypothetical protein
MFMATWRVANRAGQLNGSALEQPSNSPSNADETAFTGSDIAFTLPVSSRHESEPSRLED